MIWEALFAAATIALFLLPLLPGLRELAAPTDIAPLRVIQEYDTDITHFARNFRQWLQESFPAFFTHQPDGVQEGQFRDKLRFQLAGGSAALRFSPAEEKAGSTDRVFVSAAPLHLPRRMEFAREVYCMSGVAAPAGCRFHALMAEGDIRLEDGCSVQRWTHSRGNLLAGKGVSLQGRASAGGIMQLAEGCVFERIHAPHIMTIPALPVRARNITVTRTLMGMLPGQKNSSGGRTLVKGDLDIAMQHEYVGNIVCTGGITLGPGCAIRGSVKGNGDVRIGSLAVIEGSVVATGRVTIGRGCHISGPVIAEEEVRIAAGAVIGSPEAPVTVSAPFIRLAPGAEMHGSIWADEYGIVETWEQV